MLCLHSSKAYLDMASYKMLIYQKQTGEAVPMSSPSYILVCFPYQFSLFVVVFLALKMVAQNYLTSFFLCQWVLKAFLQIKMILQSAFYSARLIPKLKLRIGIYTAAFLPLYHNGIQVICRLRTSLLSYYFPAYQVNKAVFSIHLNTEKSIPLEKPLEEIQLLAQLIFRR